MKLIRLEPLKQLSRLEPLCRPLQCTKKPLSMSATILYSANLCLFSMRILRDEIQVPDKYQKLDAVKNEILKLSNLIQKDNYEFCDLNTYTKDSTKKFFKKVGLKPKHIEHY